MKHLLTACLVLGGAFLGGIFPGSILAFLFVVRMRIDGPLAETILFLVNVTIAVLGALFGLFLAKAFQQSCRRAELIASIAIGLISGVIGYYWCDWLISTADPPL